MTSPQIDTDILILGAGPAGMSAAYELARNGKRVVLVEKNSEVGGLARTLTFQEPDGMYKTDIGPHRFFSKNPHLYSLIEGLLDDEWAPVERHARFFIDGKYYLYPVQLKEVLRQIPLHRSGRMMFDFLLERVRQPFRSDPTNFEEYSILQFGRALAEFNVLNYTEKIWGIPCSEISLDWASQRIADLSVWSVIRKALSKKSSQRSMVDVFYYPKHGTGTIYDAMRREIERHGGIVLTNTVPIRLEHEGGRLKRVQLRGADGERWVESAFVVSSIPMTQCVQLFEPTPPAPVLEAASKLRFRAQSYLFLTVARPLVSENQWIYFPDTEIPFGRISEMKNFSSTHSPEGKTSLFVEFFCFEGDRIWNASKEELLGLVTLSFEKTGFLRREEILSSHHFRENHVYPLYDLAYGDRVRSVLSWMESLENFFAIGRPGRFRYTNQDHSIEMGLLAARSILDGKRYPLDEVGSSQQYMEQGTVPAK